MPVAPAGPGPRMVSSVVLPHSGVGLVMPSTGEIMKQSWAWAWITHSASDCGGAGRQNDMQAECLDNAIEKSRTINRLGPWLGIGQEVGSIVASSPACLPRYCFTAASRARG